MDTQGRLGAVLQQLDRIHAQDPQKPAAAEYHAALGRYCTLLAQTSPVLATGTLSEGLVLAQNAQHVARWTRPRSEYPLGLAGYKMWRTSLNKFHADTLHEIMRDAGYTDAPDADGPLFVRTRDLLLKRTLQRPPLPRDLSLLKDPEAHLFEDAICLTFLERDFAAFAAEYTAAAAPDTNSSAAATTTDGGSATADPAAGAQPDPAAVTATATATATAPAPAPVRPGGTDKLKTIVSRTWAKMTVQGRAVAVERLVGTLDDELRAVVLEAVGACEAQEDEARRAAAETEAANEAGR